MGLLRRGGAEAERQARRRCTVADDAARLTRVLGDGAVL